MADASGAVQEWYAKQMQKFWSARYQAYLEDTDPNNELTPREHELSPKAVKVDRRTEWPELPDAVREAAEFYYNRVEAEDWGSIRVYRVTAGRKKTFAVRTTTDGDDGWLEVYDLKGNLLGAGRTYIELISWAPREAVREQFGDSWPEDLDRSQTLWKLPEQAGGAPAPAPEPHFKPGEEVDCRYGYGWVWFPTRVTQAEWDRVELEFDDGSREWVPADLVRSIHGYGERQPLQVPPEMAGLDAGDRIEFRSGGEEIFFPATVLERRGSRLHVRKDDEEEEWTHPAMCRPPTPDEPEPVPPLAAGDYVACRWLGSSEILTAWVVERQGDRLLVRYEDGQEEWTTAGKCRRMPEEDRPGNVPGLAVGDWVLGRIAQGGYYYPARVLERHGDRLLLEYEHGTQEETTVASCRRLVEEEAAGEMANLAVGERVEGLFQGREPYYPGTVTERRGKRVRIAYDDGDQEWTTVEKCRRLVEEEATEEPLGYAVGDRVECRYEGGPTYYPGTVSKQRGKKILIEYDDGDTEWTTPALCRRERKK